MQDMPTLAWPEPTTICQTPWTFLERPEDTTKEQRSNRTFIVNSIVQATAFVDFLMKEAFSTGNLNMFEVMSDLSPDDMIELHERCYKIISRGDYSDIPLIRTQPLLSNLTTALTKQFEYDVLKAGIEQHKFSGRPDKSVYIYIN